MKKKIGQRDEDQTCDVSEISLGTENSNSGKLYERMSYDRSSGGNIRRK